MGDFPFAAALFIYDQRTQKYRYCNRTLLFRQELQEDMITPNKVVYQTLIKIYDIVYKEF